MRNIVFIGVVYSVFLLLGGCSKKDADIEKIHQAVHIEQADECHLCGMLISNFSGPKAELFKKGVTAQSSNKVRKFCSTRDMFSFYLDPENKRNVTTIYVHDMSKSPWESPNDSYFIDARTAWFVAGSNKNGAMGKTLASFSKAKDAHSFSNEFGGQVLTFEEVTLAVLM